MTSGSLIRLLAPSLEVYDISAHLWFRDYSLTEWVAMGNTDSRLQTLFYTNQRARFLAQAVIQRWKRRVWMKRPACGIDLIENNPVSDADAVLLTDTTNRIIFRFHYRDVYKSLLSNIGMCNDMLPTPRQPTNPWTNQPLTLGQTIGLCQQLAAEYGKRGWCPPPLFAAFWAARFCLRTFQELNAAALAQHAIVSYFKDIHDDNNEVICDTLFHLLTDARCRFSPAAITRWLKGTRTPLHREWLELCCHYTMYQNLHVQIRSHWYTEEAIRADVRALYARTIGPSPLPSPASYPSPSPSGIPVSDNTESNTNTNEELNLIMTFMTDMSSTSQLIQALLFQL